MAECEIRCCESVVAVMLITLRKRKCGRKGCKGLKNALEFDLQLQSEECLKQVGGEKDFIDKLSWKGEMEVDPDYECLRSELRKIAPVNGRAVLLFRDKCDCAVAKLEGWGSKRRSRHKNKEQEPRWLLEKPSYMKHRI